MCAIRRQSSVITDGTVRAGVGEGGQVAGRVAAGGVAALERLPPAAEQVEVDLVGLGAGDRVVVGAERQLPPRLVQRRRRVAGAQARVASRSPSSVATSAARWACLVSTKETSLPV